MLASKLFRTAPLTCLFASSWAFGLVGFGLGLRVDEGVAGAVWGSLIAPAYQLVLVGALLGIPFPWRLLACLALLALADYGLHQLAAAGRSATAALRAAWPLPVVYPLSSSRSCDCSSHRGSRAARSSPGTG